MAARDVPPIPIGTPLADARGLPTTPWMAWFRQLFKVVDEASQIDATSAAAAASSSASSAASSAASAHSYADSVLAIAEDSSVSAAQALASKTSAAASALAATSAVDDAIALMDLTGAVAYSPDLISNPTVIPINRQFIAFQRVTIASGGSLQIYGRGRIL